MNLKSNKLLPVSLSFINAGFWLLYRHQPKFYSRCPGAFVLKSPSFQFAAFLFLGFTAAWSFYALCSKIRTAFWGTLLFEFLLCGYMKAYTLFVMHYRPDTVIYQTRIRIILPGMLLGALLFGTAAFVLRAFPDTAARPIHSQEAVSRYRNHLMGIAMLMVLFFHTLEMKAPYQNPVVYFIAKNGYAGVDIFILLSGMGMVYSLSENFNPVSFYKKRIMRIFPAYIPLVGAYTLFCTYLGLCSIQLLIPNCLGLSYWFFPQKCAFNWYVPGILLFYLLTPPVFLLLKNKKYRNLFALLLGVLSVFVMSVCFDLLGLSRILMALSRFPVFLLGLLLGFRILEKQTFSHGEYLSLWLMVFAGLGMIYFRRICGIPAVGGEWLVLLPFVCAFCLIAADLMKKAGADGSLFMRFLEWTGKNSLLIYLLNIILVRITRIYLLSYFKQYPYRCMAYSLITLVLNLAVVWLVQKAAGRFRKGKNISITK